MIKYKSHCRQTKTFYGVTFHYGETKLGPGYIHDPRFVCLGNVELEDKKPETKIKSEIKGKVEDTEYLVYINAENGEEEQILIITNTPNGVLTM